VTVFDNFATGSERNLAHRKGVSNFNLVQGNILDVESLYGPMADADLVYHLAASVGVRYIIDNPVATLETNAHGTANVLRASLANGGKKVVLASSSEVYGRSPNVPYSEDDVLSLGPTSVPRWGYACSKMFDEFLAMAHWAESDLPVVILRLFNTVGPRQSGSYGMVLPRMVSQCLAGDPVTVYGDGRQTRCFAYVGDVTQAMTQIADVPEAEGQVFNLGNDVEITINELAESVRKTLSSSSPIEFVPFESVYGPDFQDIPRRVPDLRKIKNYIDYDPTTSLDRVIIEIADELRQHNSVEIEGRPN
jgi:UDP-glucose 4-epimerase